MDNNIPAYNKNTQVSEEHKLLTIRYYNILIEPLREKAKELGYALGVHGSLVRDIDLIAVPWTEAAVEPKVLAEAFRVRTEELVGRAYLHQLETNEWFQAGCPMGKPHGRLCWSYHLGGGPYLDLSVFPPRKLPILKTTEEGRANIRTTYETEVRYQNCGCRPLVLVLLDDLEKLLRV